MQKGSEIQLFSILSIEILKVKRIRYETIFEKNQLFSCMKVQTSIDA